MPTTEHTINDALAEVLRTTRRAWRANGVVRSENTAQIKGSSKRPDLLISEPNVEPVIIETEVKPAITVEAEAKQRLGEKLSATGRVIWSAIAVRIPKQVRELSGGPLRERLAASADLEMVLFTGKARSRWPAKGWLSGSAADLSVLAQSASLPPDVIEAAVDLLVSGVKESAGILGEIITAHPGAGKQIGLELRQEGGEQTQRMAATILTNAFVFHGTLARGPKELGDVQTLGELKGQKGGLTQSVLLDEWRKILKVNYWPIFDIARRILEIIPDPHSFGLIERLASTADSLLQSSLMRSHDLTGAVFQKLIADRKFLAAYYTAPESAALLVGLTLRSDRTPSLGSWANGEDVEALRVADFACGTGTLLSTAYQRIGQLHELAGGDSEALHQSMMASSLIGCDVLPSAAHLTASMLAGTHPTVKCEDTHILTVGYGRQPQGGVALGSLELMDDQRRMPIISISAKVAKGMGKLSLNFGRSSNTFHVTSC